MVKHDIKLHSIAMTYDIDIYARRYSYSFDTLSVFYSMGWVRSDDCNADEILSHKSWNTGHIHSSTYDYALS
mgnify:FL=1